MTDRVVDPDPGAAFHPAGPDPLTLAAARDTGMPGFRIVATAPPESALPPVEDPALRRRTDPRRVRLWRFASLFLAYTLAAAIVDRLQPELVHGDLPPTEWLAWFAVQVAIMAGMFGVIGELVPRAFERARIRRMRADATRSGGR